ncbi:MAG: SDR family oxidoreductase [Anaerolineales bacterium]|nr:SDR family oxidoreductase [Anaerolineales bacterium]
MNSLTGKTALITGGGSGIGQGIALAFAELGANVVVCGRRVDALESTAHAGRAFPGQIHPLPGDISQEGDVTRIVNATLAQFGKIDILVNNAAVSFSGPVHTVSVETWDQVMAINLRGPFLMCRAVLPHMRAQRSGHILNISSESGIEYYPGDAAYGTSKHALNALDEYLQRENQEFNIRVNTICPGMVVSEMTADEPHLNRAKCLFPSDIADLAVWLVTRRANIKVGSPILIQTMENPWEQ